MRLNTTFIIVLILSNLSYCQQCDDPGCVQILKGLNEIDRLGIEVTDLKKDIQNNQLDLSNIDQELAKLKKSSKKKTNRIIQLEKDYNEKSEFINTLQSRLNSTQRNLETKEKENRNLMDENRDLVSKYDFLESRSKELEDKYKKIKEMSESYEKDADLLAFDQTYIRGFEVGVSGDNGKTVFHKIYDGEKTIHTNPKLFGKKLDAIQINQGKLIVKTESNKFHTEIEGYILIYLDNNLLEVRPRKISKEIDVSYTNYESYDFSSIIITLKNKINPDAMIRIGFVDKRTFEDKRNYFDTFWEANNRNLFSLTTIEPKHENFKETQTLNHNIIVKESMSVFEEDIEIILFDNKEIDDDIVNVYFNRELLFNNLKLQSEINAVTKYFKLKKGDNYIYTQAINEGFQKGGCTTKIIVRQNSSLLKVVELEDTINSNSKEAILIKFK